ncbi:hypothetical protein CRG98_038157 [Punica granatum]|uniref:Uncharacterized protein n=1 Tax=Punica granatum TaxID=22663 RepID=A0A2I0IBT8_PUNGR|nr:hypothetical protein CRG98_038157 [Punica granatum]
MNPLNVPSGVAKLCAPEFRLVGARMRAPKCNAAWECPPSRGRATDARERESPLPVYDPKVEGRESFGRIGLLRDWAETSRVGLDWAELSAGSKWAEIRAGLSRTGLGRTGLRSGPLLDWTDGGGLGRVAGRGPNGLAVHGLPCTTQKERKPTRLVLKGNRGEEVNR